MTLIRDLIELPEQVTRGDFVYALGSGVKDAEGTVRSYVVTPHLVEHFDEALTFIKGALDTGKSRGTYLHGSFGSGKSHFMGVLNLLLQGELNARSIPKLAGVVTRHDAWLAGKKFLMVPYHMIGATSLENAIFSGYVQHLRERHPDAPTPAVFRSQELVNNADRLRRQMGDDAFFAELNKNKGTGGTDARWGALAAGWTVASYERAKAAGPGTEDYRRLTGDLIDVFFPSIRREGEFVPIDEGLSVISRHAKSLGYDALILFLDEMILWLASKAGDHQFLTSEVPKVSKLAEPDRNPRPAPIISFIARQRDLRELIGQNVTGAQSLNFADQLKFWEGRFNTIQLEDANLPFIAEQRVLLPKSPEAKAEIDAEFERTKHIRTEVMNVLLTRHSDQQAFRRLYPFSPALVETLVAVSSLLQRERTALKIMLQLLVDQNDTLQLGELVPVGDLYDEIAQGDEAFSSDMKRHFDTAHRLYRQQLRPMLEDDNGLTFEEAEKLDYRDPKREALRNDDRLIKTLLLAALAPEVDSLKNLTPARLAALNHGTIKSPIPGQEANIVLKKVRKWAGQVGQIKISEGSAQHVISIQLTGVDVEAILAKAETQDNFGNRIRLLKSTLFEQLGIAAGDDLWVEHKFRWRGTDRRCKIFFQNVREAGYDTLEEHGEEWKLVVGYPIDRENRGPKDGLARLEGFRTDRGSARTLVWLPSLLGSQAQKDL
ncbi:MAG: phage resistance protein, partial [Verrucomicrobia bacterium]|nr:phage resistance protein [Verrucomicrobiota bacterium]